MEGVVADIAAEPRSSHVSPGAKWFGRLDNVVLDCPLYAAWDLFSDWTHWDRFVPGKITAELREGENRKPGCLRYHDYPDTGFWITERLLAIDEEEHSLHFNIEKHTFLGGAMTGYKGWVKFGEAEDGNALLEYWRYEVDPIPLEGQSPHTFDATVMIFYKTFLADLEKGGRKLAEANVVPTAQPAS